MTKKINAVSPPGMRRFVALSAVLFFVIQTSFPAWGAKDDSTIDARCQILLTRTLKMPDGIVEKARKGAAIHDPLRSDWELSDFQFDELDLKPITQILEKKAMTAYGRGTLKWLLQHPRTDAQQIRQLQTTVLELHEDQKLRTTLRDTLTEIRNFETRNLWTDRLMRKIRGFFGSKEEPEDRNLDTRIQSLATPTSQNGKAMLFAASAVPNLVLIGEVLKALNHPETGFHPPVSIFGISQMSSNSIRFELRVLTYYMRTLNTLVWALKKARSPYLQELGRFLDLSDSDPLKIKWLAKGIGSMTPYATVGSAVNMSIVSSLYLAYYKVAAENKIARFMHLIAAISEIDALQAFSHLYENPAFHTPQILDNNAPIQLELKDAHHPLLVLTPGMKSVPNDASLAKDSNSRLLFLTGGNDRGKTTYIRSIALASVFAQNGLPVAAESATLSPIKIISNIRKSDSTEQGLSSFRSEARRVGQLLKLFRENPRSLLLLDETFTGTDNDSRDVAERALLSYLSRHGALALIASHSRNLTTLEGTLPGFKNLHGSDDNAQKYQIQPGPSRQRNAFDVLKEEDLPPELLEEVKLLGSK